MHLIRFIPNILSFSRIPLAFFNIALFAQKRYLLIILIIMISFLSDILDGAIARRFNCVTTLGKYLDKIGDTFAALAIIYMLLFFEGGIYTLPYAPLSVKLLAKSRTYHHFDMIEFTHMDILDSFLSHCFIPCLIMASFIISEIHLILPYLLIVSTSIGAYCALEGYKEWKLGPFSRGPYFGRFLW